MKQRTDRLDRKKNQLNMKLRHTAIYRRDEREKKSIKSTTQNLQYVLLVACLAVQIYGFSE